MSRLTFLSRLVRRRPSPAVRLVGMYLDAYRAQVCPIVGRDGRVVGWRKG